MIPCSFRKAITCTLHVSISRTLFEHQNAFSTPFWTHNLCSIVTIWEHREIGLIPAPFYRPLSLWGKINILTYWYLEIINSFSADMKLLKEKGKWWRPWLPHQLWVIPDMCGKGNWPKTGNKLTQMIFNEGNLNELKQSRKCFYWMGQSHMRLCYFYSACSTIIHY